MGKPSPTFWWDRDNKGDIIVQSDYDGGECLARFPVTPDQNDAWLQVSHAAELIDDYTSGRKTPNWNVRA